MDALDLDGDPFLHLGDFGKAVRNLEALELTNNFRGLKVLVKVDELNGLFDRIRSELWGEGGGEWALGGVSDVDKGQLSPQVSEVHTNTEEHIRR